jgi:hypothetical protein
MSPCRMHGPCVGRSRMALCMLPIAAWSNAQQHRHTLVHAGWAGGGVVAAVAELESASLQHQLACCCDVVVMGRRDGHVCTRANQLEG